MAEIPNWLQSYLGPQDLEKIESAIAQAEQHTTAEIVPMVVHRSSHIGHVPYLMMALLVASFLSIVTFLSRMDLVWISDLWLILGTIIALAVGFVLSRLDVVQRFAVPIEDRWHQVDRRAELEFYEAGLQKTDGRTAILLFISISERHAVLLADEGIASKLSPDTWAEIIDKLVQGIRAGQMEQAYSAAISQCGEILREHFPAGPDGRNELLDHLIIKE